MPPVSRKHGRPLGSRNKKTLAALAATAAAASAEAVPATAAAVVPAEVAGTVTSAMASIGVAHAGITAAPPVAPLVLPPARCASLGARR
jgi:hypothetical protein